MEEDCIAARVVERGAGGTWQVDRAFGCCGCFFVGKRQELSAGWYPKEQTCGGSGDGGALRAWRHACGADAPQGSGGFDAGTCAPVLRIQTWLRIAASHAWLRRISFLRCCSAVPCVFPCIGEKNLLYCLHAKPPAKGVLHKRLLREIRRIYGQIRNRRLAGNHCR